MPRQTQLATVPTEALVAELQRRFAEVERAKKRLLADGLQQVVYREGSGREQVLFPRKRGGTSPYAQRVSEYVQKIRHATTRIKNKRALPRDEKNIAIWQKHLAKLRASHKLES